MGKKLNVEEQEERAACDEAKAIARRLKAKKQRLLNFIDKNPMCIDDLLFKADQLAEQLAGGGVSTKLMIKDKKEEDEDAREDAPVGLDEEMKRHHNSFSCVPVLKIMQVLMYMNSIRFTMHSLKALMVRGQRTVSREALGGIVEYLTGLDAEAAVGPGMYDTFKALAVHMLTLLKSMPGGEQRAALLPLPPHWPTDGVYTLKNQCAEFFVLERKWQGDEQVVHQGDYGFKWSGKGQFLRLNKNWSDNNATIVDEQTAQMPMLCRSLFQVKKSDGKRKAIEDSIVSDDFEVPLVSPNKKKKRKAGGAARIAAALAAACPELADTIAKNPNPKVAASSSGHTKSKAKGAELDDDPRPKKKAKCVDADFVPGVPAG